MTVREPNLLVRIWHWLTGRPRNETARETELRQACESKDETIASLKHELADARNAIHAHEMDILRLTDICERDRRRVQAETAAATFHKAIAMRGREES